MLAPSLLAVAGVGWVSMKIPSQPVAMRRGDYGLDKGQDVRRSHLLPDYGPLERAGGVPEHHRAAKL